MNLVKVLVFHAAKKECHDIVSKDCLKLRDFRLSQTKKMFPSLHGTFAAKEKLASLETKILNFLETLSSFCNVSSSVRCNGTWRITIP